MTGEGYCHTFVGDPRYEASLEDARPWVKEGGGLLAADSPQLCFEMIELFRTAGIPRLAQSYLGQPALISVHKTTLRKAEPVVGGGWHQDGAFMGDVRALNLWLSLSRCGDESPGLDIVPRRLEDLVKSGGDDVFLSYQVSDATAAQAAGDKGIMRPIFEPGDALLFDDLFLHKTASDPAMPRPRFAIENWFFGGSAFPLEYAPLLGVSPTSRGARVRSSRADRFAASRRGAIGLADACRSGNRAPRDRGARPQQVLPDPQASGHMLKERAPHPFARTRTDTCTHCANLLRRAPGRVLRHRRPQRLGQEHAAQDHGEHLPGRRRKDAHGRTHGAVHRARRRFQPRADVARELALNGVLMGLGRREAARRLDAVLEFAELRDFVDLKLKNYSSGMMVRLAFAMMVEADADIMLIDEVLAVGDAAFGQKCIDVFYGRCGAGRTIVLVTHDMATVQRSLPSSDADPRRACSTWVTPRRRRSATTGSTSPASSAGSAPTRPGAPGRRRQRVALDAHWEGRLASRTSSRDGPISSTACSRPLGTRASGVRFQFINAEGLIIRISPGSSNGQ